MLFNKDDFRALARLLKESGRYRLVFGDLEITKGEGGKMTVRQIVEEEARASGPLHSLEVTM